MTLANSPTGVIVPHAQHDDWLSQGELASLSLDRIVERVTGVGDLLAAEAAETERQRHPTQAAWSAVRRTGAFYLYVPKAFGGLGTESFSALADVVPRLAEHCASTAWCAVQCLFHQWMIGLGSPEFQNEIFGRFPYLTAAGSAFPPGKAVRVDGGFRVSGGYSWGTGISYAQWVFGFAMVEPAGDRPEAYCFFMPVDEVTVLDSWRMDGMAGTGSHDFQIRDVFVPAHRIIGIATLGGAAGPGASPINRVPMFMLNALAVSLPILGAARGVVKAYRARLSSSGPDRGPSERALDHVRFARAELDVTMAERAIRDGVAQMEEITAQPSPATELEQAEVRAQFAYGASLCRDAVRAISDASGSSAHALSHPLQRAVRDINMLSTHSTINLETALETLGRLRLGLAPIRKTILQAA